MLLSYLKSNEEAGKHELESLYDFVSNELFEILGGDQLLNLLEQYVKDGTKIPLYWGTAPTGIPSIGYFEPLRILTKFFKLGCFEITILIADLHAYLDSMKSALDVIEHRSEVYIVTIKSMLSVLGLSENDIERIKFVKGSSFQLTREYQMDLFKLGNMTTIKEAQHSASEVIKQNENPYITSLQYPMMQALDEKYLKIKCQLGGVDQRKIMSYSRDFMSTLYEGHKCIQMMNPLLPGISKVALEGKKLKMSSSDKSSKLSVLDSPKEIKEKIKKAYCLEKDVNDNTVLDLVKTLVFPILKSKEVKCFTIERPEKHGGKLEYTEIDQVIADFSCGKLHPSDLKQGVSDFIIGITDLVRLSFNDSDLLVKAKYVEK